MLPKLVTKNVTNDRRGRGIEFDSRNHSQTDGSKESIDLEEFARGYCFYEWNHSQKTASQTSGNPHLAYAMTVPINGNRQTEKIWVPPIFECLSNPAFPLLSVLRGALVDAATSIFILVTYLQEMG